MPRRRGAIAVAVIALVAVAGALLLEFDATGLGRAVLERAGVAIGGTLSARSVRLRPLSGLVLDGVEASSSFTGGRAAATIDRLVLDHRLARLLHGEIAVDRLVLQRPKVRLVEASSPRTPLRPATPAGAAAAGLGRLSLRVSRIDVEDATVELQAAGQPRPTIVKGLELHLRDIALEPGRVPLLAALSGVGDVRVAEVSFASSRALDLRGSVRVGGGHLKTDTVHFRTDQGPFEATLDIDLARLPLAYALTLSGQPLDVATIMGAPGFGAGTLKLDARGVGPEADGLQGTGVLKVAAGTLPATPTLRAIEQALGRTHIVGGAYQPIEAPFRVERGRVILDGLHLQTEQAGLDVSGWASLAGPLELSLAVHTPREGLAPGGVAGGALDLLTDEQGRVVVPLKVTGTQQAPHVAPDTGVVASQMERAGARKLLEKAGLGIGSLFHKKPHDP